jgi:hypothetical protein
VIAWWLLFTFLAVLWGERLGIPPRIVTVVCGVLLLLMLLARYGAFGRASIDD